MNPWRYTLLWLVAWLTRLLAATLRLTIEDKQHFLRAKNREPVIICFWHNRILLMQVYYEKFCPGYTGNVFVSSSRDGQWISDMASQFGLQSLRGSTSKGGAGALRAALQTAEKPRDDLVLTPDGPRGPIYEIQPGLIYLAAQTQRPIIGISYNLGWKVCLSSWDHFEIPLPFSRCHLVVSEPVYVPKNLTKEEMRLWAKKIDPILGEKR